MLKPVLITSLLLLLFYTYTSAQGRYTDNATPSIATPSINLSGDWVLDFSDEFNDNTINTNKWNINLSTKSRTSRLRLGIENWYWKRENAWEEDGNLVLKVSKENSNTMYCGSINSNNKYETQYGYFEARVKIAEADKGTHTAFWLTGKGMSNIDGTANDGAEIDIFESAWLDDYTKSVVHIDGYGNAHQANTVKYSTPNIHEGYHTWGFLWTEEYMKIYYDGILKVNYSTDKWVVRAKEYLWLSDGASFGYGGDNFTKLALGTLTHAYVDYVRVWKKSTPILPKAPPYECEQLRFNSPTDKTAQVQIYPKASNEEYVIFNGSTIDDQIEFTIPGEHKNYHYLQLDALSYDGGGIYKCEIETKPGVWIEQQGTLDFYNRKIENISFTWGPFNLEQNIFKVRFTCTAKNKLSRNYIGSFDKINLLEQINSNVTPQHQKGFYSYPVPSTNYVNFKDIPNNMLLHITNIHGQYITSITSNNPLNISTFTQGIYIAKTPSGQTTYFIKR